MCFFLVGLCDIVVFAFFLLTEGLLCGIELLGLNVKVRSFMQSFVQFEGFYIQLFESYTVTDIDTVCIAGVRSLIVLNQYRSSLTILVNTIKIFLTQPNILYEI